MPRPDPFAALYETDEKEEDTKSILSYAVSKNSNAGDDASDAQSITSSNYDYRSPFRNASASTKRSDRIKPSEHSKHNKISVPSKFFSKVDEKNKRELEKLTQQEERLTLARKQHEDELKKAEEAQKKLKADQEVRKKELEKLKQEAAKRAEEAKQAQKEAIAKLKQKTKEIEDIKKSSTEKKEGEEDVEPLSDVNADEDSLYTGKKDETAVETPKKSSSKDLKLPKDSKSEDLAQSEADELLAEEQGEDEVPLNKEHNSPIKAAIANEVPLTAGTDTTAVTTDTELTKPDDAADAEIKDKDAPLSTSGKTLEVPFKKDPFNKTDDKENDISGLRRASAAEAKLDEEDAKDSAKGRRKSVAEQVDEEEAEATEIAETAALEKKLGSADKDEKTAKGSGGFNNPFGANSDTQHHKIDKTNSRGLRRASAAEALLDAEDAKASSQGRKKSAAEIADEKQAEDAEVEEAAALEKTLSKTEEEKRKSTSGSLLGKATSVFTNPFGSSGEKATVTKSPTSARRLSRSSRDEHARGLRRASAAEALLDVEDAKASSQGRKKSVAELADEEQAEAAEIEEAAALEKTLSESEAKEDLKNLRKTSVVEAKIDEEEAEESAKGLEKSTKEEAEEEKAEALDVKEAADLESKLAKEDEAEDSKTTKSSKSSGITGKPTPQKKKLFGLIPTSTTSDDASTKPSVYDTITEANKKHDEKLKILQNKNKSALEKIEFDYNAQIKKLRSSITSIEDSITKNVKSSKESIAKAKADHETNLKKSAEEHEEEKKKFYEETETKITDKHEEVEDLKKQQEETTKDLEELEKLQIESSEKLKEFEADIQKLKAEIRGEQSKLDDLEKEKDTKTLELEKLNDEREALVQKLQDAKTKTAESGKILSSGDDDSSSYQKQLDSLTADIEKLSTDLTKSIKNTSDVTISKGKLESTLNEKKVGESREKSNKEKLTTLKERAEATEEHQTSKIQDSEKELKQLKDNQANVSTRSRSKSQIDSDVLKEREELERKVAEARAKREAIQKELQNASNDDFEYIERESIAEL